MSCNDDSCYRGTHFERECPRCMGTGEKSEIHIGPLYISFAHFWKPNRHQKYLNNEDFGSIKPGRSYSVFVER